jgi:hypothetical protein
VWKLRLRQFEQEKRTPLIFDVLQYFTFLPVYDKRLPIPPFIQYPQYIYLPYPTMSKNYLYWCVSQVTTTSKFLTLNWNAFWLLLLDCFQTRHHQVKLLEGKKNDHQHKPLRSARNTLLAILRYFEVNNKQRSGLQFSLIVAFQVNWRLLDIGVIIFHKIQAKWMWRKKKSTRKQEKK